MINSKEEIKLRARLLKRICKGKDIRRNMMHLIKKEDMPEFVIEFYLKLGRLNVQEIEDWWDLIIVTTHLENYDKCHEWLNSIGFYTDGGVCDNENDTCPSAEVHVDIERSYIKHLELLAGDL